MRSSTKRHTQKNKTNLISHKSYYGLNSSVLSFCPDLPRTKLHRNSSLIVLHNVLSQSKLTRFDIGSPRHRQGLAPKRSIYQATAEYGFESCSASCPSYGRQHQSKPRDFLNEYFFVRSVAHDTTQSADSDSPESNDSIEVHLPIDQDNTNDVEVRAYNLEHKDHTSRKETVDPEKHISSQRGEEHVDPQRYKRADVDTPGLACPFAKSDPERYMNIDVCRVLEGFKEPRLLLYVGSTKVRREYFQEADIFAVSTSGGNTHISIGADSVLSIGPFPLLGGK